MYPAVAMTVGTVHSEAYSVRDISIALLLKHLTKLIPPTAVAVRAVAGIAAVNDDIIPLPAIVRDEVSRARVIDVCSRRHARNPDQRLVVADRAVSSILCEHIAGVWLVLNCLPRRSWEVVDV